MLCEVWVIGDVTPTGGFLPRFKLPGWPKLWGFFSSPLSPKSSPRLGGFFLHLLGASVLRLPESKLQLLNLWLVFPSSLYQESPLSTRERFSASVRSCREEEKRRHDKLNYQTTKKGMLFVIPVFFRRILHYFEKHFLTNVQK